MNSFARHRTAIASATVLLLGAALLVAYAYSAPGYQVHQAALNDGGIWVTSDRDGLFGRLNKPVGSLDAAFYPPGGARQNYQLDVVQDASAVVARDHSGGKLFPVDVARSVTLGDRGVPVPAVAQVQLAGGTLAVLDPSSGKLWATRVDTSRGVSALTGVDSASAPVATLDPSDAADGSALAVGLDGVVHAIASTGKTVVVRPSDTGFADAQYGQLDRPVKSPRATAVGSVLVVLDQTDGTLVLPDAKTVSVGQDARLQQTGPDSATVVVATGHALRAVDLESGEAISLLDTADGEPTAPVRLADCVHAAWAGPNGGYARSCGGEPASPGNLKDVKALVQPVFRVNRSSIVLNDLATGALWDLSSQQKVDDWSSVKPPPVESPSDKEKNENTTVAAHDKPPKAVDDVLGARAGRTTVLHVLDNDSDPAGSILSISAITAPDTADAVLAIAPNGQTVQVTVSEQSQDVHFTYTVDDGKGLNATAAVTVEVRTAAQNEPPAPRKGYQPKDWTVPSGGRLSLPVLADWRDFDGDPIVLVEATTSAGTATTTPFGFVEYAAPLDAGTQTVDYRVIDGVGDAMPGAERVTVQDAAAPTAVAPIAQPDVARGQVGTPVTVRPLENDLPGSDPSDPTAELRLAAEVAAPAGVLVSTDVKTGAVVVTGTNPGPYLLDYTVAFGNAPFAKGSIRVDVAAAPDSPAPPVAMPDSAVLRGQQPATVDVLVNDSSPSGSLLAVQQAAPAVAGQQIEVAVVKGRWLRLNALTPTINPNPQLVRYTITDGVTGPITGEVTVTQLPAPADDTPVPSDDHASVRAGDSVTIPVLDNDISPTGAPLSLQANVPGAPERGQLAVTSRDGREDVGAAYVSGGLVRFVAPPEVSTPVVVSIDYVAQNPAGDQAVGHAEVTVHPAPTQTSPNQPPTPRPVEVRVVAGDTATITVPTSGVDPDGDSTSVTGIGSAATLGRVLSTGATSVTYQAFPSSAGTDSFAYVVTDSYGKTGEASIRVAVVPPGDPQPPVAVDDVVTAAPGAKLTVDVVANDLHSPDDAVEVEPLDRRNPSLPAGTTVRDGVVELTAPELTGKPAVIAYALANGIGQPSLATLTVRVQEDFNTPPVAADVFALPEGTASSVEVDPLGKSADPDGDSADLKITEVFIGGASTSGGKATVPVSEHPRTIAYEITDGGGATAVGLIHVPAPGSGAPHAKPDASVDIPTDGTKTIALADYVVAPSGKPVRLTTTDKIWAAPATGFEAHNQGDRELALTARNGYAGPAAVTFQVTDGTSLTDPEGLVAVITIPVRVGPDTPVLRCPTDPLTLVEGGEAAKVDVSSVCHVWVADRSALSTLAYTATWLEQPPNVEIEGSGGRTVSVTAAGGATPGATGSIEVGVVGSDAVKSTLAVKVTAAAPPSIAPVTVDGVKAGDTAVVDLTSYVRSQLRDPKVSVVGVSQTGGGAATATAEGSTVRLTPSGDANGTMTFSVVVTDVADTGRDDRKVNGLVTLHVLGVPDAPGTPSPGRTVLSKVVELSWSAPANNGAPVDSYEVDYGGGKQTCPASPCSITGLSNGTAYTFTVRAHNLVGWSKPSGGSAPAEPNTVPGAVTGLVASNPQDGTLQLAWNAPRNDGTPVLRYELSWTGGGRQTVAGGTTSATATGLDNNAKYVFTVIAVNSQGPGEPATAEGQSAGAPSSPPAPTFTAADSADSSSRAVSVSWGAVTANGPTPVTYTLTRTGGGTKTVCSSVQATTCADDGLANDGTVYSYSVTAANGAAASDAARHTSPPSASAQMEATATPDPITGFTATPTGNDGQVAVTFDAPASHGASNTVTCTWGGGSCGTWTYPTGGQRGATQTVNGLPNGQAVTLSLQACNGSGGGAYAGNPCGSQVSASATPYGPIRNLNISTSANGQVVDFSVSVDPNGKPATVQVQTSRQNQTFTTGVGAWSWSGSDNVGYSSTDTITVTVSDGGRATVTQSKAQTTPAAPPPPPSVTVSKGGPCAATCAASCTSRYCAYIVVQTANFTGGVTCTFTSDHGPNGFVNQNFGANETRQTQNWYGYPNERVYVTCGGVQGQMVWS